MPRRITHPAPRPPARPAADQPLNLSPETRARIAEIWRDVLGQPSEPTRPIDSPAPASPLPSLDLGNDGPKSKAAKTLAEWQASPRAQQSDLLYIHADPPRGWKRTGLVPLSEIRDPAAKKFAEAMVRHVKKHVDFEVEPDQFATVGKPEITVDVVTLPNGEIAGGNVHVYQEGASIFDLGDDAPHHFATKAKAEKAGAKFEDINWSAWGTFTNASPLEALELDPAMEWSGH